jgi:hypothetical protein
MKTKGGFRAIVWTRDQGEGVKACKRQIFTGCALFSSAGCWGLSEKWEAPRFPIFGQALIMDWAQYSRWQSIGN